MSHPTVPILRCVNRRAKKHFVPAVYPSHRMVDQGGLLGIGVDIIELFKIGGDYAGRILRGADPSDLPVRTAEFSTVLNIGTANLLGLTIPLPLFV